MTQSLTRRHESAYGRSANRASGAVANFSERSIAIALWVAVAAAVALYASCCELPDHLDVPQSADLNYRNPYR